MLRKNEGLYATSHAFVATSCGPISSVCIATHVAKVFQTLRSCSAVFRLGSGGHLPVRFPLPCWLQVMSQGKAVKFFQCEFATAVVPPSGFLTSFIRSTALMAIEQLIEKNGRTQLVIRLMQS